MERLTIEAPDAYAAVSLLHELERDGATPRIAAAEGCVAVEVQLEPSSLERVLAIVQRWLDAEEIASARLRLHGREFTLAA